MDLRFNGTAYDHERDSVRLTGQLADIVDLMSDGGWRTLSDISENTGHPSPSISAQLRHLRKPVFGSNTVERRYIGNGLFEYRLLLNSEVFGATHFHRSGASC